jgi:hypothetical protein
LERAVRLALIVSGAATLILALGFFLRLPWATALWPWPDGRLSFVFVASIAAAVAAPVIWIGATGELGAATAGALNLAVTLGGAAGSLVVLSARQGATRLLAYALAYGLVALAAVAIMRWSRRIPLRDPRPVPRPVRLSFAIFAALLILTGGALLARAPHPFPWPLNPQSSVLFGWIFLGNALYFLHGFFRPGWANAAGQLLAFLAYDLVLIGPLVRLFATVRPEGRPSLIVYIAVLVYSGLLAAFYLFVYQPTRFRLPAPGGTARATRLAGH